MLRQFQVNFSGFCALDVNSCLQATFNFVGKGQQRKRHDKPGHRQPESATSGILAILQAWHYDGRSTFLAGPSESNETIAVIGHIHDTGPHWIFIGAEALSLVTIDVRNCPVRSLSWNLQADRQVWNSPMHSVWEELLMPRFFQTEQLARVSSLRFP